MSETSSSSEPATGPVATAPPPAEVPAVVTEPRRNGRLNAVAAWVGIVAGVIFIPRKIQQKCEQRLGMVIVQPFKVGRHRIY